MQRSFNHGTHGRSEAKMAKQYTEKEEALDMLFSKDPA
jgi:hypothetical protein